MIACKTSCRGSVRTYGEEQKSPGLDIVYRLQAICGGRKDGPMAAAAFAKHVDGAQKIDRTADQKAA